MSTKLATRSQAQPQSYPSLFEIGMGLLAEARTLKACQSQQWHSIAVDVEEEVLPYITSQRERVMLKLGLRYLRRGDRQCPNCGAMLTAQQYQEHRLVCNPTPPPQPIKAPRRKTRRRPVESRGYLGYKREHQPKTPPAPPSPHQHQQPNDPMIAARSLLRQLHTATRAGNHDLAEAANTALCSLESRVSREVWVTQIEVSIEQVYLCHEW